MASSIANQEEVRASCAAQELAAQENGEEEASGFGLLSDCLVENIFSRLTSKEKLVTIPIVCRRWNRVSRGALCWQSIDLLDWAEDLWAEDFISTVERMIEMLVTRSDGCLLSFAMSHLPSDASLRLVAQRGQALQRLIIPSSEITDECVRQVALLLPSITHLDIRGCNSLSQTGLEAFGQLCKCLTNLKASPNEEQCLAIAQHMPQLKHLRFEGVSKKGLQAIVDSCTTLEVLDLQGSTIYMNEALLEEYKSRNIKVVWSLHKWHIACGFYRVPASTWCQQNLKVRRKFKDGPCLQSPLS